MRWYQMARSERELVSVGDSTRAFNWCVWREWRNIESCGGILEKGVREVPGALGQCAPNQL